MSGNRNFQRRALESLIKGDKQNQLIKLEGVRFYLGEEEIYLLGVSVGVGTCSDMHGVDIAVFSRSPLNGESQRMTASCAYAALLKPAAEEDLEQQQNFDSAYMIVEGLKIIKQEWNYIVFILDGTKAVYVNTIT